jgi:septal ring factor EnvC (AmiA/AmiB activator)
LRARLVQLAGQEKAGVAKAQTAAARLSALNAAETQLKAKVGANQQSLTRLLGALQNYQRDPPPALLVSPRSARDAVNAAILMRAVTPELQRRAKAFAEEGKRLNALRREILIADGDFLGAEHDVADRRAEWMRWTRRRRGWRTASIPPTPAKRTLRGGSAPPPGR